MRNNLKAVIGHLIFYIDIHINIAARCSMLGPLRYPVSVPAVKSEDQNQNACLCARCIIVNYYMQNESKIWHFFQVDS